MAIERHMFKAGEAVWVNRSEDFYRGKIFKVGAHSEVDDIVLLRTPGNGPVEERYRFVRAADVEKYVGQALTS